MKHLECHIWDGVQIIQAVYLRTQFVMIQIVVGVHLILNVRGEKRMSWDDNSIKRLNYSLMNINDRLVEIVKLLSEMVEQKKNES